MNWVDLVIILVLIYFIISGLNKPFFLNLFDLVSFMLAFLLSLKFYNLAAVKLEQAISLPHSLANVLGFISLWYGVEIALFIFSRISRVHAGIKSFQGEKILTIIPSLIQGVIFISILLILVVTFPFQPKVKNDVQNSYLGSFILTNSYQFEAPLKKVFGDLAQDTLTFLTIKPKSDDSVNLGFRTDQFYYDENQELKMVSLVNQERERNGRNQLKFDPALRQVGRIHSGDMLKRGYFAHYSPEGQDVGDRAQSQGVNFMVIGENLAFAPTLQIAHQGLINSPGHRANILSPDYHYIGIGIAKSEDYGLIITQVFKN